MCVVFFGCCVRESESGCLFLVVFVSCLCVVLAGSFVEAVFCVDACVCGVMCVWCGVCDV